MNFAICLICGRTLTEKDDGCPMCEKKVIKEDVGSLPFGEKQQEVTDA